MGVSGSPDDDLGYSGEGRFNTRDSFFDDDDDDDDEDGVVTVATSPAFWIVPKLSAADRSGGLGTPPPSEGTRTRR